MKMRSLGPECSRFAGLVLAISFACFVAVQTYASYGNPVLIAENGSIVFYENETQFLARTETVLIDHRFCLEYRLRIEGKRTRVHVYGCRMSEGGLCTVDGFRGGIGTFGDEHCHWIRAWMYKPDKYAFFFALKRRARSFNNNPLLNRRYLRRLRKRNVNAKVLITLGGIRKCREVCVDHR